MLKTSLIIFSTILTIIIATPSAFAKSIYLNGVDISNIRGQTFKNVKSVFIDDSGDIHMTAPGYNVEIVDDTPASTISPLSPPANDSGGANALLRSRYFMATSPSKNGAAQYDFHIKINGVERKIVKAGSPVIIMEISAWFKKGANEIEIIAIKNIKNGRTSTLAKDKSEILIGAGHEDGSLVKIDVVHGSIKADAAQLSNIIKRFTINAI